MLRIKYPVFNVLGCLTGTLATEDSKKSLDFSFDVYDDMEDLWVRGPSSVTVENIIKKNGIFCLRRFGSSTVDVENLEAG